MLTRIVGILLGLALAAAGYAITHPLGLGGRIPVIALGPFGPQGTFLAWAAYLLGFMLLTAAVLSRGPGGSGGGKRRRAPSADFTSGPVASDRGRESSEKSLQEAQPGALNLASRPPGEDDFELARWALHKAANAGNWTEAAATLRRLSSLARSDHDLLLAAQDTGDFARSQGQVEAAADAYGEALALARRAGDPNVLADALINVGDMAQEGHRLDDAVSAYEEAVSLRRACAAKSTEDLSARRALSLALERLGDAREDRGHRARAVDLYRESMSLAGFLALADPGKYGSDADATRRRLAELEARLSA